MFKVVQENTEMRLYACTVSNSRWVRPASGGFGGDLKSGVHRMLDRAVGQDKSFV